MITDSSPAAIRPAAFARLTTPSESPIWVAATMNGSEVDCQTPATSDPWRPSKGV